MSQTNTAPVAPVQAPSIGIFKSIGMVLGLVGTSVNVVSSALNTVDRTVTNVGGLVDKGFEVTNETIDISIREMRMENSITMAELSVKEATARTKADEILKALEA